MATQLLPLLRLRRRAQVLDIGTHVPVQHLGGVELEAAESLLPDPSHLRQADERVIAPVNRRGAFAEEK